MLVPDHPSSRASGPSLRRRDIQGLRAVAVLAVLLFHLGVPGLGGGYVGVDVFFVVSGFLITGNLLREHARHGRVSLARFWARRVARLAPPAVLVVVATIAACAVWMPPLLRPSTARDAVLATFGVANIDFARVGTHYLSSSEPSVFQHFWSLGVEEQFYLLWPVALVLTLAIAGRRLLGVVLGVATTASFALCLWLVTVSQPWAFFSLPSRAWELGVGALLAVAAGRLADLPRVAASVLGWLGLGAIAVAVVAFDESTVFPGAAALLPVLGTAAVIAAGTGTGVRRDAMGRGAVGSGAVDRLLSWRPLTRIGDVSYPLYLWHWPLLIIPALALERDLRPMELAAVAIASCALAALTHVTLERRLTPRLARRRPLTMAVAGLAAAAVVVGLASAALTNPVLATDAVVKAPTVDDVRAGPDATSVVPSNLAPSLADVGGSIPPIYGDGCHADYQVVEAIGCSFGDPAGPTTALLGDSHAAHWFSPLRERAERRGEELVVHTKLTCPVVDITLAHPHAARDYTECRRWRDDVVATLNESPVDTVVVSHAVGGYRLLTRTPDDFEREWTAAIERLVDALPDSTRVVVLGDTPRWPERPALCLSIHLDDAGACSAPIESLVDDGAQAADRAGAGRAGATWVPTIDWMCTETCSPVIWNALGYRDTNHLTDDFARVLGPRLDEALDAAR
ncbi:acyltransferase family protein [Frigoribacterium faeni]|uniref:Acyltransferase n=1 Tax=Frigoribacterium faeni TaxID=145483 RepID=A0A7W3JJT8_9MICO|nr:acyltransferase family protein [Frigoribacterium faeni]MBA8814202.1 peptidoglycan/LPS O-acetylase OafA/YrhL [Frigoribacterium faeni]GEK84490.1 acyltransferase [Frigoribacterium faeni]